MKISANINGKTIDLTESEAFDIYNKVLRYCNMEDIESYLEENEISLSSEEKNKVLDLMRKYSDQSSEYYIYDCIESACSHVLNEREKIK